MSICRFFGPRKDVRFSAITTTPAATYQSKDWALMYLARLLSCTLWSVYHMRVIAMVPSTPTSSRMQQS